MQQGQSFLVCPHPSHVHVFNVFPRLTEPFQEITFQSSDSDHLHGILITFQRGDPGVVPLVVNNYNICRLLGLSSGIVSLLHQFRTNCPRKNATDVR